MLLKRFVNRLKFEKAYILGVSVPLHYFLLFVLVSVVLYGLRSWVYRDKWNTLAHEQYGFVIDYPANWQDGIYGERGLKNAHDLKAQFYTHILGFLGPTSKALRVYWTPMEGATLAQAVEWGLEKSMKRQGSFSDLQETWIGANNYPALTRTFEFTDSSSMYIQYYVVHGNSAYLLEFYLLNKNDADEAARIFSHMLSSFQIVD